jgi:uncharacterized protein (TIGR02145 family)
MKTKTLIYSLIIIGFTLIMAISGCKKDKENASAVPVSLTDIDGNVYKTVTIGTQVWMAQNLNVTRYRNGDSIGTTIPATRDISGEQMPKYQWAFSGSDSMAAIYGRLYTLDVVRDSRKIAPAGWHVPTYDDWTTLTTFLGGLSIAGSKMKSKGEIESGTGLWHAPNSESADEAGFRALPAGYRNQYGYFVEDGKMALWWTSTEMDSNSLWYRVIDYRYPELLAGNNSFFYQGLSVRCIKDN